MEQVVIHYRELLNLKYQHDFVSNVLFDIFRQIEISIKKDTPLNFLTDPGERRSTLTLADV